MQGLWNAARVNGRRRCEVEAAYLKEGQAPKRDKRMVQVWREEQYENECLQQGIQIIGQHPIKHELTLRKWAGKQEFEVRRVESETALKKPFEERAAEHDHSSAEQALRFYYMSEYFLMAIIK